MKQIIKKSMENYDPRTYYDYLKLGDVNTKPFLMFAELIDNSISSFEKKFENDWNEKLVITIKMNFDGPVIDINGYKTIDGSYISFVDNGFGMNEDGLRAAVKLNNKNKSSSKMNVHGRGLKQSAFYFGVDLSIMSSTENEHWKIEQKLSDQENDDAAYYIDPQKGPDSARGTEVLIENILENKKISYTQWINIKETLEYRYIKYFESGKIAINFEYIGEPKGELCLTTEPHTAVAQQFDVVSKGTAAFNDFFKKIDTQIEKRIKSRGAEVSAKTLRAAYLKIKDLFAKGIDDSEKVFEFSIPIKIGGKVVEFDFWMLPSKHARFRGIRLFEGERAIYHAGYRNSETKPYMSWKKAAGASGQTEDRFAGKVDLSILGLKSKVDKSSFTISEVLQKELNKQIFSVWNAFDVVTIHARKEARSIKGTKPSLAVRTALENIADTRFPDKLKYVEETEDGDAIFRFETRDNDVWSIEIKVNEKSRPKKILEKSIDDKEDKLNITVFTGHAFWNNMTKLASDFYIEAVIPIALLFGMQYIDLAAHNNEDPIDILGPLAENFK